MRSLLVSFFLLLSVASWAQDQKFGHVDTQTLLLELPEREGMEAEIKRLATAFNAQVGKMEDQLNQMINSTDIENMSDLDYEVFSKKVQLERSNLENYRNQCITSIKDKEIELLAPMVQRLKDAVQHVAEEGQYSYIFELSQVNDVFPGQADDLTQRVRERLEETAPQE